ncbi:MAG: hypothetical protein NC824_02855 [Candidatus Omnitrophica bacterium]|nr:hypothetical protein [Candidatus Omnitrophota bacterium]
MLRKVREKIVRVCYESGVSPIEFNQGAWYLGFHSFRHFGDEALNKMPLEDLCKKLLETKEEKRGSDEGSLFNSVF